jgi:hypothetical protein
VYDKDHPWGTWPRHVDVRALLLDGALACVMLLASAREMERCVGARGRSIALLTVMGFVFLVAVALAFWRLDQALLSVCFELRVGPFDSNWWLPTGEPSDLLYRTLIGNPTPRAHNWMGVGAIVWVPIVVGIVCTVAMLTRGVARLVNRCIGCRRRAVASAQPCDRVG